MSAPITIYDARKLARILGATCVNALDITDAAIALCSLADQLEASEKIRKQTSHALECDRTAISRHITRIQAIVGQYCGLTESRGSYEWDDDQYREESGRALKAFQQAIEPMKKVAADWSNCPQTQAELLEALKAANPLQTIVLKGDSYDVRSVIEMLNERKLGTDEGDVCKRDGCNGVIHLPEVENCSCHISAPCPAHESQTLCCPVCGWEAVK